MNLLTKPLDPLSRVLRGAEFIREFEAPDFEVDWELSRCFPTIAGPGKQNPKTPLNPEATDPKTRKP